MAVMRNAFMARLRTVMSKWRGKTMRGNKVVKRSDRNADQSPQLDTVYTSLIGLLTF
jgi:hypothetical protein